jgi:hypothetical protein
MPTAIKRAAKAKPSLKRVSAEVAKLRARVEDLEDLRDLNDAIVRNAGKPGTSWGKAKKELGLT